MAGYIGTQAVSVNTTSATISDDLAVGDDALITGTLTTTAATVFNGGFASNAVSTITTADNAAQLSLISTDTDQSAGPRFDMYRNPGEAGADSDNIGQINFFGLNDNSEKTQFVYLATEINDAADGSEDSRFTIGALVAGADSSIIEYTQGTPSTGADPEIVFNNTSRDINFRVESDGQANMLFVDGGANLVGIGTGTPIALSSNVAPGLTIKSNGPFIVLQDANNANSCNYIANNSGVLQFGLNADDGGSKVEIAQFGTFGAVFNEGSADLDFRVESDDKPFCLFVNSTQDNVSIGYSAESQQSSKGLVVLSGDETGGVYIVKEDGSQPSSGEGLGSLGWRGIDDTNHMGAADAKISAFATENHDGSNSATDMRFFIKTTSEGPGNGATETMRLESNKNVKILDGNLVIGTAGHGIDFAAQSSANSVTGVSTTAELLNHYERGTWTPGFEDNAGNAYDLSGFSNFKGQYVRIGDFVFLSFFVNDTGTLSGNTSFLKVTGLPFNIVNTLGNLTAGAVYTFGGFTGLGADDTLIFRTQVNSATAFVQVVSGGTGRNVTQADFGGAMSTAFTFSYRCI